MSKFTRVGSIIALSGALVSCASFKPEVIQKTKVIKCPEAIIKIECLAPAPEGEALIDRITSLTAWGTCNAAKTVAWEKAWSAC